MRAEREDVMNAMRSALLTGVNADGGWGYASGRLSRLEPTVWATLALGDRLVSNRFLRARDRMNGLLVEPASPSPNIAFNALHTLVLAGEVKGEDVAAFTELVGALLNLRGRTTPPSPDIRQDNTLRGWPWTPETFSWVEPTSWCLLALKKAHRAPEGLPVDPAHVAEGERLLIDRVCRSGGWNYGNANVLGDDLSAYVPTTATALLALQDRGADPVVQTGLSYLWENRTSERSGMALALVAICLDVYGRPVGDVHDALVNQFERTAFLGSHHVTAMALYALSASNHELKPFWL